MLLQQAGFAFHACDPMLDELPFKHQALTPERLVVTLAEAKARAVQPIWPHGWIIGSDQCAEIDGSVLGKPGDFQQTIEQLERLSGRTHRLLTGLCLLDAETGRARVHLDVHTLHMRRLTHTQLETYVARDRPYDCAGGYRIEAQGIRLFESIEGHDYTAIIGLPVMQLATMLAEAGVGEEG